jgi:3-dehydrotetronate 4-kinase
MVIGEACAGFPLITGGSGVAIGLPENFRRAGLLKSGIAADALPSITGHAAVLSGSCSRATNEQVALMARDHPSFQVDPRALARGEPVAQAAVDWATPLLTDGPVLVYATAAPDAVRKIQSELGADKAGALVEEAMAAIARGLVDAGVRRLIVAGGETSGAVVGALNVPGLRIGPEIDPGVPWTASLGNPAMLLALKSGNFGTPDFFTKAFGVLS